MFRPMKSRESKREASLSLSLSPSLSLSTVWIRTKMRSFGRLDFLGYLYMRHMAHVAPCVTFPSVRFCPKIIYFMLVSVSYILSGHSLNI